MSRVTVVSGFLGAGKTTLIKKLLKEAYSDEKIVLIENEFGEIGIDGGFLKEAGINITEMNSGCICCSLTGDFKEALKKVKEEFEPDHILIEPSGVGKLSDVMKAVEECHDEDLVLGGGIAVVDAMKYFMYTVNFGEFFNDQVEHASTILLSRTQKCDAEEVAKIVADIKEHNPEANIITTPWDELDGKRIAEVIARENLEIEHHHEECHCHEHGHHHHHDHDEECCCHHEHHEHHHHDELCCCHEHEHEEECHCHDHEHHHEHHHDHGEECCCHHEHHEHHHHDEHCCCHEHGHHHHHHADEVFESFGFESVYSYTYDELETILKDLSNDTYGTVLRCKGIVASQGTWYYFDMGPEEYEIREGQADFTGRVVVIGSHVNKDAVKKAFKVN
ncbi:MAG: GTP-binding protein [Erysipelotrichales bacterium]|nr:GTP-binding protein [Erysipelotrichales bacterium]